MNAMNKLATAKGFDLKACVRQLSKRTVCPCDQIPERSCVDRACETCGSETMQEFYSEPLLKCSATDRVKCFQWETISETYTNKKGKIQKVSRWVQSEQTCDPKSLVDDIQESTVSFTSHQFRADYRAA